MGASGQDLQTVRVVSDIAYGGLFRAVNPTSKTSGTLRNTVRFVRSAFGADVVLTNEGERTPPGLILLALALWTTRQRKLVLTEFLPGTRMGIKGRFVTVAYRLLLPRVLIAAQVMTPWERDDYSVRYGIPESRLHVIPFYFYDDRIVPEPVEWGPLGRSGIVSTGKNSCDWPTVIASASGTDWPLTIVCPAAHAGQIAQRAAEAGVSVRSDVPRSEHDSLLSHAELLIISLENRAVSAGHVRLMTAATFGTPVVLSDVRGIAGYEQLAAALVPAGDPDRLREAVNELISDSDHLASQMAAVRAAARARPYSLYATEIQRLVVSAVGGV